FEELLEARQVRRTATRDMIAAAAAAPLDSEEALIMHDTLLQELNKPITPGKRNITLFAVGAQMHEAGYPGWEDEVTRRADEVGLDALEGEKIVANIERYKV